MLDDTVDSLKIKSYNDYKRIQSCPLQMPCFLIVSEAGIFF